MNPTKFFTGFFKRRQSLRETTWGKDYTKYPYRKYPMSYQGQIDEMQAKAGIKSMSYVSPETAHEWLTWRRSFHEVAPYLFQD